MADLLEELRREREITSELLAALNGFMMLGGNVENMTRDPILFRKLFDAAVEDARAAIAKTTTTTTSSGD